MVWLRRLAARLMDVMVVLATAALTTYRISLGPSAADIAPDSLAYGSGSPWRCCCWPGAAGRWSS